jgi:5-methylcytosine-specific restriction endonuclease McrA
MHHIPRGGSDNIENLQLMCAYCNSVKGDRPQECLVARLRELGIAT